MIYISKHVINGILNESKNTYPEECCGLLEGIQVSSNIKIDNFHPSLNTAANLRKEFEIDIRLRLQLQRELRNKKKKIVGVYHSHPDEIAYPSSRDMQRFWETDMIWLISSVNNNLDCDTGVFTINDSRVLSWKKKYFNRYYNQYSQL